jgi:hypothetical protein
MAETPLPRRKHRRLLRRYRIPASATIEGKEHERVYFEALGRFAHAYARVESIIALSLWYSAGISHPIAKAVFSGVKIKETSGFLKRIAEVTGMDKTRRDELDAVLKQLGDITAARNDILHYGAEYVAEGRASVTNALKALTADRITNLDVSPKALAQIDSRLAKDRYAPQGQLFRDTAPFGGGEPAIAGTNLARSMAI